MQAVATVSVVVLKVPNKSPTARLAVELETEAPALRLIAKLPISTVVVTPGLVVPSTDTEAVPGGLPKNSAEVAILLPKQRIG